MCEEFGLEAAMDLS